VVLILVAVISLVAGGLAALLLKTGRLQIIASLGAQAVASVCVLVAVVPVLMGGTSLGGLIEWSFPINNIHLKVDALSALFLLFSVPMTFLGTLYAKGYLEPYLAKKRDPGSHFALLCAVSFSYLLIYCVENSIVFLLGWEVAAVSAWLLVIWDYHNQKIRFAGFNYLISTHVGLLFLIAALLLLHSATGSFDFRTFGEILARPGTYRNVIFILLVTSFGLKSAFFPFHTWLPRAHSAAPAHVSALMSGVIHKAGLYGILRVMFLMGNPDEWMGWYLIGFSGLSAFAGVLYTVTQRDLKRLLGYSSTENVGIAGIGIGLGSLGLTWNQPLLVALGFTGAVLHVLNHAVFKCLLFYAAGSIYRMVHVVDLERLGGLIKSMPWTAGFYLLGGLAISAVPPFNGFVSEFLIYNGLLRNWNVSAESYGWLLLGAVLLAVVGAISAMAVVRSFGVSFLGVARDPQLPAKGEAPRSMLLAMAAHAIGILVLGLIPATGLTLVQEVTHQFVNLLPDPAMESETIAQLFEIFQPLAIAIGIVVLLTALVYVVRRIWLKSRMRFHVTWGCGYQGITPRMQYSGSSFSDPLVQVFKPLLRQLRRENLPRELFPKTAFVNTHFVDAVERRIFKVIGEGEELIQQVAGKIHEGTRASFAFGLVVIVAVVTLLLMRNGIL